jgi:predicted dithiol-disulfide oxidoreductase (DUF899 family)
MNERGIDLFQPVYQRLDLTPHGRGTGTRRSITARA